MKEITIKRRIKSAIIFAHKEGGGLYNGTGTERQEGTKESIPTEYYMGIFS